jgi:hypothetical protein
VTTALLVPEPPLLVLPRLAAEIGLNEAIALNQLHFWTTRRKGRSDDGWIYNTLASWREQFPFWSEDTIKRTWASLRKLGLVEVQQRRGSDRTNSYRVVYDAIPSVQMPPFIGGDRPGDGGSLPSSLEQAETTQRDTSANADAGTVIDLFEFWSSTLHKRSPKLSDKRKRKVRDRLREGFTADEIRAAIVGVTLSDHHMGRNGSPRKYDDLELICRDPEHVETFRDLYLEKHGKGEAKESAGERANRRREEVLAAQG